MAQFDVHRYRSSIDEDVRYLVVIQSNVFDDYRRRLVAPLVVAGRQTFATAELTPGSEIEGSRVILLPLQLASIPVSRLGRADASLVDDDSSGRIVKAIDLSISHEYRARPR